MTTYILGIRHHGPGSARSLVRALTEIRPDVILIEGPPDADSVIHLAAHHEMKPPVALLVYVPDDPQKAVYYPFAAYSPEWQAIQYGLKNSIPTRFMDFPQMHRFAENAPEYEAMPESIDPEDPAVQQALAIRADPLSALAAAAGFSDGERWWEHMVEHRQSANESAVDVFTGILEGMTALREADPLPLSPHEAAREAWMRRTIRAAEKEGYERIAVICGAWHSPALANMPPAKHDDAILKKLPKIKTTATWIPWTYSRLSRDSGYGAGVESPGWYHHLFVTHQNISVHWLSRVANLLRREDLDASTAQVIDAARLAESLAAMRDRPVPGLPELNEATLAVLCNGNEAPMKLIRDKLIVGERLGEVPSETPMMPLQQDLQREQRRLNMKPSPERKPLKLDLRNTKNQLDRDRSFLLHRLNVLNVPWGKYEPTRSTGKGTSEENWTLQWKPEYEVQLIEASTWGTTIETAATGYVVNRANHAPNLPELTNLLNGVLLANLPEAAEHLTRRVQEIAALTSDVNHLMDALPPLAQIERYRDVRQTDTSMIRTVVDGMITRICIGLPGACATLDDEAADAMFKRIMSTHTVIERGRDEEHTREWRRTLHTLTNRDTTHGLIVGRATWLLIDTREIDAAEAARRLGLALSRASDPKQAAAWIEGLLRGNGVLVAYNSDALVRLLDAWLYSLPPDLFIEVLPLLRRTFSTFSTAERRKLGEQLRSDGQTETHVTGKPSVPDVDHERGAMVLPTIVELLA
jgi:hypothetical protein